MDKWILVVVVAVGVSLVLGVVWWLSDPDDSTAPSASTTQAEGDVERGGPPLAKAPAHSTSMYRRLGQDNLVVAVDQFYHRVLGDERLRHYFAHMTHHELAQLRRHQAAMLGQILGGPVRFELSHLATAHQRLRITNDAYWLAVGHLVAVLTGLRVDREIVLYLMRALYDVADYIVDSAPVTSKAS